MRIMDYKVTLNTYYVALLNLRVSVRVTVGVRLKHAVGRAVCPHSTLYASLY